MNKLFVLIAVTAPMIVGSQCSRSPDIRISSPLNGAVVHPGEVVTVMVSTHGAVFSVGLDVASPLRVKGSTHPFPWASYKFTVQVPDDANPGLLEFRALGLVPPDQYVESQRIVLDVERADRPVSIAVEFDRFDLKIGDQVPLQLKGTYRDNSVVPLGESTQTRFVSLAENVARVSKDGFITAVGAGSTEIVAQVGQLTLRIPVAVEKP